MIPLWQLESFVVYTKRLAGRSRDEQVGDRIWEHQRKIHRLLHDEVVMIPLWQLESFVVYTKRLAGRSRDGQKLDLPVDRTTVFRRVEDWFLEPAE